MGEEELPKAERFQSETELELKFIPDLEMQLRLKTSYHQTDKKVLVDDVLNMCKIFQAEITPKPDQEIIDKYYDTKAFSLYEAKNTCRIRRKNEKISLDIKTHISVSDGKFERQESNFKLSAEEIDLLVRNGKLPDSVYSRIKNLPHAYFQKILKVTNSRTSFIIINGDAEIELCIDVFRYKSLLKTDEPESEEFFEIELESKNDAARRMIGDIRDGIIGMKSGEIQGSEKSKYQVGVDVLGLKNQTFFQKIRNHVTKPYISFLYSTLLALILAGIGYIISLYPSIWSKK